MTSPLPRASSDPTLLYSVTPTAQGIQFGRYCIPEYLLDKRCPKWREGLPELNKEATELLAQIILGNDGNLPTRTTRLPGTTREKEMAAQGRFHQMVVADARAALAAARSLQIENFFSNAKSSASVRINALFATCFIGSITDRVESINFLAKEFKINRLVVADNALFEPKAKRDKLCQAISSMPWITSLTIPESERVKLDSISIKPAEVIKRPCLNPMEY